ncbi:hypothetical protein VMCG_05639 [Cytospora schulzeri]|uniref:Fungal lipase-type domain-containing protein n=1 Tax=Cytospora schulzeri TaxID=448051 RepID=A0A423WEQ9_9PEZI|nr:hypothetical protein VMCG_05639 [Valsa malicola]
MGWFTRNKTKKSSPRPGVPPPVPVNAKPAPPCPSQPYHGQTLPAQYHAPQISGTTRPNTSCPAFQPAGYLPPPPGWNGGSPPPSFPYQQQNPQQASIVVNQHYYLLPAPQANGMSQRPQACEATLTKLGAGSVANLAVQLIPGGHPFPLDDGTLPWNERICQGSAEATDHVYQRFNNVMTLIDQDRYAGNEKDLFVCQSDSSSTSSSTADTTTTRGQPSKPKRTHSSKAHHDSPKGQTTAVAASVVSGSYFAKVELYANSRLPMNLPPLKLYISTWPLLCLAAQYSDRVYEKARGSEKDMYISADSRSGTRATVIKSVPMDHMNTIVFAIRGTATFMDWAVNLDTAPTSPVGFLAARKMIKPVATRLRQLLQEDPSRSSYSLLITGHSAGGAVAALLYAHMLSSAAGPAGSELNALTACFRRVHCVTFGAPPVSLLPLQKPEGRPELGKSLFLSFVNEGDPVARADKAYVRSLLELFARPAPATTATATTKVDKTPPSSSSSLVLSSCPKQNRSSRTSSLVPPSTLSNAGRIVVLRSGNPGRVKGKKTVEERLNEGVVAQVATDEQLRSVIWGNPVCHVMKLYAGRLEILAVGAVTAKGY